MKNNLNDYTNLYRDVPKIHGWSDNTVTYCNLIIGTNGICKNPSS